MLLLFFTQHEKRVPLAPMRIPYKSRPCIFRLPDAACQCPRPIDSDWLFRKGYDACPDHGSEPTYRPTVAATIAIKFHATRAQKNMFTRRNRSKRFIR